MNWNSMLPYFMKVNLLLLILIIAYRLIAHPSKHYQLNRIILLIIPLFAISVPLVSWNFLPSQRIIPDMILQEVYFPHSNTLKNIPSTHDNTSFNFLTILMLVYLFVMGVFLLKLLAQVFSIRQILGNNGFSRSDKVYVAHAEISSGFSYFNRIFLPQNIKYDHHKKIILNHERIHVEQWHSLDLVFIELIKIVFWLNPAVWLLKFYIKEIHEFIADREMIRQGNSLADYLQVMYEQLELGFKFQLTNSFKGTSVKKRIMMLSSNGSSRLRQLVYLLFIPLLATIIFAFSPGKSTFEMPSICPVKGAEVSLRFGYQGQHPITNHDFTHQGIDYKTELGREVSATAGGTVIEAAERKGYGKLIIIDHGEGYQTFYAHLNDFEVKVGDKVVKGETIGHVGNTGYSTGPHLHYEIRKDGVQLDPEKYYE